MATILSLEEALTWRIRLRAHGRRLVFTNGCFDLLHPGHLRYLAWAKSKGDYLLVATNSDRSVRKLKGLHRPIMPLVDRMEMLAALSSVDAVVSFTETDVCHLLRELSPEIFVKGGDYNLSTIDPLERESLEEINAETIFAPLENGYSTTKIVERLEDLKLLARPRPKDAKIRTLFLDRDGVLNQERGHITSVEQFEVLAQVPESVATLNRNGIDCVVVTNQSGLARGLLDSTQLEAIHAKLRQSIAASGGALRAIYVSPTYPDRSIANGNPDLLRDSWDRKPNPGMILRAVKEFDLDLSECAIVGDSLVDFETSEASGIPFFGIRSSKANELSDRINLFPDLAAVTVRVLELNRRALC